MGLRHQGTTWMLSCDVCQARILGSDTLATCGIQGNNTLNARFIFVHAGCRSQYQQFFLNEKDREISIATFKSEMGALA